MNDTSGDWNQPPSGLRGDPVVPRTSSDDTRDKGSSSRTSDSVAPGSALVEKWRIQGKGEQARLKGTTIACCGTAMWAVYEQCATELEALAALSGAEIAQLQEWKSAVSSAIHMIPEFASGAWAGDKEGWGFHFEMVNYCRRQRETLAAECARLRPYVQHKVNCRINITRQADDSAAYLSEQCSCGLLPVSPAQQETP